MMLSLVMCFRLMDWHAKACTMVVPRVEQAENRSLSKITNIKALLP